MDPGEGAPAFLARCRITATTTLKAMMRKMRVLNFTRRNPYPLAGASPPAMRSRMAVSDMTFFML